MNNPSLILRYPSPNIKISKKDSTENLRLDLSNSGSKFSAKEGNILQMSQSQTKKTNENTNKFAKNNNEINNSASCEKNKLTVLFEKLNSENNILKKKLGGFEDKLQNPKFFKNTEQVLDFKSFIKSVKSDPFLT